MSIEDDVVLLDRVPTFHLLGNAAIRVLAIGSEQQEFASGSVLFRAGDASDCGYVVQRGSFHLSFPGGSDVTVDLPEKKQPIVIYVRALNPASQPSIHMLASK